MHIEITQAVEPYWPSTSLPVFFQLSNHDEEAVERLAVVVAGLIAALDDFQRNDLGPLEQGARLRKRFELLTRLQSEIYGADRGRPTPEVNSLLCDVFVPERDETDCDSSDLHEARYSRFVDALNTRLEAA